MRHVLALLAISISMQGNAQTFPSKPLTMVVGFVPGGGTDTVARVVARFLADNIQLVHVPYKGGGPAMRGLVGGEIDSYISPPVEVLPHVQSGRVYAIASTGLKRSTALPNVPTIAESGYPGYEAVNWYAYLVPAKTPRPIVELLNRELGKVLRAPE